MPSEGELPAPTAKKSVSRHAPDYSSGLGRDPAGAGQARHSRPRVPPFARVAFTAEVAVLSCQLARRRDVGDVAALQAGQVDGPRSTH